MRELRRNCAGIAPELRRNCAIAAYAVSIAEPSVSIDFAATAKTIARIDAVIIESQTMAVSDLMRRTVVRPKMRGTPTVSQNCLVDHGRYFIHRRLSAYPERSSKSKLKTRATRSTRPS